MKLFLSFPTFPVKVNITALKFWSFYSALLFLFTLETIMVMAYFLSLSVEKQLSSIKSENQNTFDLE